MVWGGSQTQTFIRPHTLRQKIQLLVAKGAWRGPLAGLAERLGAVEAASFTQGFPYLGCTSLTVAWPTVT